MKIGVIDYGMSNLGSVCRALTELGAEPAILNHVSGLDDVSGIILPGVGNFADGMATLTSNGWPEALRHQVLQKGKPLLGICLGMQLLATRGTEGGDCVGLDLIPGDVVRLDILGCRLRIPHIGWNSLELSAQPSPLTVDIGSGTDFYFVHSFAIRPTHHEHIVATTDYGVSVAAAVGHEHIFGTQFHPEKSSKAGFKLLKNFLGVVQC